MSGVNDGIILSIVIACYNGAETLGGQLEALAHQGSEVPWEVVVADNGSTDSSVAVARSYAPRLTLRVVDAAGKRGPAHARNVGVAAATGEWIAFCDADDVVADDWIARVCDALRVHPFVAGRVDTALLNPGTVGRSRRLDQEHGLQPASGNRLGLPHAGAGNMAFHKQVFTAVGGFDEDLRCLEDTDLCWRIQLAGTPLVFDPAVLIYTRFRATLRDNYRQGAGYGRGQSMLEDRYGPLAPTTAAATGPPPSDAGTGGGAVSSALHALRSLAAAGTATEFAWQLGWHVGRQRAKHERGSHAPAVGPLGPDGPRGAGEAAFT